MILINFYLYNCFLQYRSSLYLLKHCFFLKCRLRILKLFLRTHYKLRNVWVISKTYYIVARVQA